MLEKVSPVFQLFEKQYREARSLLNALGKNFRSKKALELEERLIFINVYLHVLNKIHFKEERLKFESFSGFRAIDKSLKRIHHYKLVMMAFEEEKGKIGYASYEAFLLSEKKSLYKDVYELIVSRPLDIWEKLYVTTYDYSKGIKPLMIDTATHQLINEELEYMRIGDEETLDSQAMRDVMDGLRIVTVVENINIAVGLNPVFTSGIHKEMRELLKVLAEWNQTYLFAQHLNHFLSDNEQVGNKYLDLAKRMRDKKKRLALEVASLYGNLFSKL
jgi:hypothetical protein